MKYKNISELNEKMWYRVFKIIWCGSFIYTSILFAILVFNENGPYRTIDPERSLVNCDNGSKLKFKDIGLTNLDIEFYSDGPNFWSSADDQKVKENCRNIQKLQEQKPKEAELRKTEGENPHFRVLYDPNTQSENPQNESNPLLKLLQEDEVGVNGNYKLDIKYDYVQTAKSFISATLLIIFSVLSTYLGFEILRRVVYYVLTGKFRPEKS